MRVSANFLVRNIEEINDAKGEWKAQLTFRQTWVDDRLKFDNKMGRIRYLYLNKASKIWTPDTFFKNERESHHHELLSPNTLLRIYPDGKVLYSVRISLTMSCPMDLALFPFDEQVCSIEVTSCK